MSNLENTQPLTETDKTSHPHKLNEREKLIIKLWYIRSITISDLWEVARGRQKMPHHPVLQKRWKILKSNFLSINNLLKR